MLAGLVTRPVGSVCRRAASATSGCRAFCDATGQAPHQHLLHPCVVHAELLIVRRTPLAEVALLCGLAGQRQFSRGLARRAESRVAGQSLRESSLAITV